ncbi:glycosyltransferase family 4 protein [uncultured Roseivirga sp.]|uniref:glycosyltransferase family 4 protein n=1 Tax=uncultured Roseivirga sp. TaxID=543088 RepID=UPI000D7A3355|nr:glycosyltransferase family 4 protein [uncultured Roseivirga sp.]PWL32327.1 MAG: hypothetical protein DCO95_03880 [Roseivirga sp. XM-24bin3]
MQKTRIFLGAFTNQTNAQNLSCRALAKYLDKEKFEVYTLEIGHGNLKSQSVKGVHVFRCNFPVKLTGILGFFWGFYKADVVYLPRGLFINWQRFLCCVFKVKTFKTVRNVIDEDSLVSAMSQINRKLKGRISKGFDFVDRVYSMTPYMSEYNYKKWGIKSDKDCLLPPTDFEEFRKVARTRHQLRKVIFIGNDWKRKRLSIFLDLANKLQDIEFHVVGKGDQADFPNFLLKNVYAHGLLTEMELLEVITSADLHILPSNSEGLPRVWLETLANGIPSILFKGYGAEDFVKEGVTGFVVSSTDEAYQLIEGILDQSIDLSVLSKNCQAEAEIYDPIRLTKKYEQVIEDLYAS